MLRASCDSGALKPDRSARARRPATRCAVGVLVAFVAVMLSKPAAAAEQGTDPWVFEVYATLFVPSSVTGLNEFPPGASSPPGSSDVGVSDDLVDLRDTFIGGFTARHERWGLYTYLIYVDLQGTRTGSNVINIDGHPLSATTAASARLGIRDTYALVAGTYRLVTNPNRPLDVLLGARIFSQHRTLDWQLSGNVGSVPPSEISGTRSISQSGADAILGF